ncbi:MAG: SCP2 sterol-binding domain-containing protein [Pseudomonadota bacterium]
MSDVIEHAVNALNEKLSDGGFEGTAKFVIDGEGAIMLDSDGARAGDEDAEVTMSADTDTFREILDGSLNPTTAFMSGRLKIDGDMGAAMRLAPALS